MQTGAAQALTTDEALTLAAHVMGTAAISKVTLIRNEVDHEIIEPQKLSTEFKKTFVEEELAPGDYRYYLRVEQVDGNMGWTSPVWVTVP